MINERGPLLADIDAKSDNYFHCLDRRTAENKARAMQELGVDKAVPVPGQGLSVEKFLCSTGTALSMIAATDAQGFSERNLKRMLAFYNEYQAVIIGPTALAQLGRPKNPSC